MVKSESADESAIICKYIVCSSCEGWMKIYGFCGTFWEYFSNQLY